MNNINQMPIQKLPMSKKTKDWQESCIDYVIGRSLGGSRMVITELAERRCRRTMIFIIVYTMKKI